MNLRSRYLRRVFWPSILTPLETRAKDYMISRLFPSLVLALILTAGCTTPGPDNGPVNSNPDLKAGEALSAAATLDDFNTYRLGEGDTISIQVFDEPDLTLQTAVGASGSINYSYLGDIKVAGKSPVELERHIAGLLKNGYLVNPSVNITVTQYRPFYINGEVRSPGGYSYRPGLTLDRAIALAGGLTDRASTRKMFVTKANGDSSKEMKITMKFKVRPGDTITIREGFF